MKIEKGFSSKEIWNRKIETIKGVKKQSIPKLFCNKTWIKQVQLTNITSPVINNQNKKISGWIETSQ